MGPIPGTTTAEASVVLLRIYFQRWISASFFHFAGRQRLQYHCGIVRRKKSIRQTPAASSTRIWSATHIPSLWGPGASQPVMACDEWGGLWLAVAPQRSARQCQGVFFSQTVRLFLDAVYGVCCLHLYPTKVRRASVTPLYSSGNYSHRKTNRSYFKGSLTGPSFSAPTINWVGVTCEAT